jgi:hypothetical protein
VPELSLTSRSLRRARFDLFKPLLKRFAPEENTPTDAHTREVWDTGNLVMDDVAEMGTRTSHKGGSFGEVQDFGDRPSFEVDRHCHRMRGGRRTYDSSGLAVFGCGRRDQRTAAQWNSYKASSQRLKASCQ